MAQSLTSENSELNKSLEFSSAPARGPCELQRNDGRSALPGQPRVRLQDPNLDEYLRERHLVPDLDSLVSYLWLVATPDHAHISPLHHQAARGRSIVVIENPYLHLVWYYDRIFIKPIPPYLLSHAFWKYLEYRDEELWKAACGFMRTYAYLIQYEIDFRKAQSAELGLIPPDDGSDPITYERFAEFITPFSEVGDESVIPRYHYGELRLTRLNLLVRILLRKLTFHHIHGQWSTYLGSFIATFISVFLILSTILTAMQVELAVQTVSTDASNWELFAKVSRWSSILVIMFIAAMALLLILFLLFIFIHDLCFTGAVMRRKKKDRGKLPSDFKSGVV